MPWSYSAVTQFDKCPKQYYHLRIAKDYKDEKGAAAMYGDEVHKAAENRVKHGTPVPEKYEIIREPLEALLQIPGEKHAEIKMGIRRVGDKFEPCGFFDKDVWYRGIADLVIIKNDLAYVVDHKTGASARYADVRQLDLMSAAVMVHFPQIERVKSALLFLVPGVPIKKNYTRNDIGDCFAVFDRELEKLEHAEASGVWNAKPSGLCRQYCAVVSCPHNGRVG